MKDWKVECEKLKGENKSLRESLSYERDKAERREFQDRQVSDKFKELLIEVLGRN